MYMSNILRIIRLCQFIYVQPVCNNGQWHHYIYLVAVFKKPSKDYVIHMAILEWFCRKSQHHITTICQNNAFKHSTLVNNQLKGTLFISEIKIRLSGNLFISITCYKCSDFFFSNSIYVSLYSELHHVSDVINIWIISNMLSMDQ